MNPQLHALGFVGANDVPAPIVQQTPQPHLPALPPFEGTWAACYIASAVGSIVAAATFPKHPVRNAIVGGWAGFGAAYFLFHAGTGIATFGANK